LKKQAQTRCIGRVPLGLSGIDFNFHCAPEARNYMQIPRGKFWDGARRFRVDGRLIRRFWGEKERVFRSDYADLRGRKSQIRGFERLMNGE
jgi:hypothetical protein